MEQPLEPLELIALGGALLKIIAESTLAFGKIHVALSQNAEMTAEERKAFEDLRKSDYAKDYWKPND